jgi:hypothetical protein
LPIRQVFEAPGRAESFAPASKGENVAITVSKDLGLLADTIEPAPGAVCTSPIQTYLDLSHSGERGGRGRRALTPRKALMAQMTPQEPQSARRVTTTGRLRQ